MNTRTTRAPAQGAKPLQLTWQQKFGNYGRHHADTSRDALRRMVASPVPAFLTILVLAIALALPTGLYSVLKNVRSVMAGWADDQVRMSVFLKTSVADAEAERLVKQVAARDDVSRVTYVSREKSLADFAAWSGMGDVLAGLDGNPLPAVLIVQPRDVSAAGADALRRSLATLAPVEEVQLDLAWVQRLQTGIEVIERLVKALGVMLAVTVLLVIGNTIRLAIENRRDEIVVIKLVGGTDAFVRRPFLHTGFWYGFVGAFVALAMVETLTAYLETPALELAKLYGSEFRLQGLSLKEGLTVIGSAILLGLGGAAIAVRQHLRDIEPHASI
jgi:cell division transport system permease protein